MSTGSIIGVTVVLKLRAELLNGAVQGLLGFEIVLLLSCLLLCENSDLASSSSFFISSANKLRSRHCVPIAIISSHWVPSLPSEFHNLYILLFTMSYVKSLSGHFSFNCCTTVSLKSSFSSTHRSAQTRRAAISLEFHCRGSLFRVCFDLLRPDLGILGIC